MDRRLQYVVIGLESTAETDLDDPPERPWPPTRALLLNDGDSTRWFRPTIAITEAGDETEITMIAGTRFRPDDPTDCVKCLDPETLEIRYRDPNTNQFVTANYNFVKVDEDFPCGSGHWESTDSNFCPEDLDLRVAIRLFRENEVDNVKFQVTVGGFETPASDCGVFNRTYDLELIARDNIIIDGWETGIQQWEKFVDFGTVGEARALLQFSFAGDIGPVPDFPEKWCSPDPFAYDVGPDPGTNGGANPPDNTFNRLFVEPAMTVQFSRLEDVPDPDARFIEWANYGFFNGAQSKDDMLSRDWSDMAFIQRGFVLSDLDCTNVATALETMTFEEI